MKIYTNYPLTDRIRALPTLHTPKNLALKTLIFLAVFFCASIVESVALMCCVFPAIMSWIMERIQETGTVDSQEATDKINGILMDPKLTWLMLMGTIFSTICVFFYLRFVEGRKVSSIGFYKKGALKQYLIGLAVGFVLFSLVVLIGLLDGGLQWNGLGKGTIGGLILVLIGFGLQGMNEEVICRGYLMTTILRHQNVWWAVGVNSVLFGLMHAFNKGFTIIALVNLILFGAFASVYALRTDNLWGACAVHSIWNFVQGNFYGLPVSGIDAGSTIFSTSLKGGNVLLNGGDFGLEASIGTTIVLTAGILVLLFVKLPFAVNDPQPAGETA